MLCSGRRTKIEILGNKFMNLRGEITEALSMEVS
jgi:hypothetical protein